LSLINSNGKLIFLHKGIDKLPKASKYDFVLSPQFYISKREQIPVKYKFQAKKLAPSILDDLLPSDREYEFIVNKDEDSWLFIAYSPSEIEEFLKKCCNISANKINNIYFADQLKNILKKAPLGIDENSALTLLEGKATIVPRDMISDNKFAKFSSKLRPKNSYKFKTSKSLSLGGGKLDKSSIILASLIALLGVAFLVEGYIYKGAIKDEETKIGSIFEDYPQLQSKLTRDSIKAKYSRIEHRERRIRDLLNIYSQLTSKKSILDKLEISGDKLIAQFNVSPNELHKIEKIAKDNNLKFSRVNSSLVRVEGSIRWIKILF